MKKIFISYRRSDSYDIERLAGFLRTEYGHDNIFFDTESMSPGMHWPQAIKNSLMHVDLMLLIIGPDWLLSQDAQSGKRRIDMDADWVRQEIITFLERKKSNNELLLVPVLVNDAALPGKQHLDDFLAPICDFQAKRLYTTESPSGFMQLSKFLRSEGMVPIYPKLVDTPPDDNIPDRLKTEEEDGFFKEYPNWKPVNTSKTGEPDVYIRELYRFFDFKTYEKAWKFIAAVDKEAVRPLKHHPRWQNTYNRVEFWLSTFNVGHNPSQKDIRLAKAIEGIWNRFKK